MNGDHAAQVLSLLEAAWPKGPWPEETENMWLRHLASYELDDARAAVDWLVPRQTFTPTMAHWAEAIREVRADARRRRDEAATRALGAGAPSRATDARMRALARDARSRIGRLEHNHLSRRVKVLDEAGEPVLDEDGFEVTRMLVGAEGCPICGRHDHSDVRVAGYCRGGQVKCWELSCPACGDPNVEMTSVTQAGVEVARRLGSTVTAPQEAMSF